MSTQTERDMLHLVAQIRREHKARNAFRKNKSTGTYNAMMDEERNTMLLADEYYLKVKESM